MRDKTVLFPHPDAPVTAMAVPAGTVSVMHVKTGARGWVG